MTEDQEGTGTMNYNEYTNPKATQISKNLAIATLVIALVGIVAAIMLLMKELMLPALLLIIAVLAIVLSRGYIEAWLVSRITDEGSTDR